MPPGEIRKGGMAMAQGFGKTPLWECTKQLAAVAAGEQAAELVITDARLVNVCTGEILPHTGVAVAAGRIALVGDAAHCIGPDTEVVDAGGKYLAPGFMDGHMHLESAMVTAGEYARAAVPHGTTAVFADPHEICNVMGLAGVQAVVEDAARTPLKVLVTTPACVPAVPGFEDSGAEIGPEDVRRTMDWDAVVGLGEMMNYPGVIQGDARMHAELAATLRAGKTPTGHFPLRDAPRELNAYTASGVRCCHESTRSQDALAKMRLGMYAMLRQGSAWQDLKETVRAVTGGKVDPRYAVLVSDDLHPGTLARKGHMDHILRLAVEAGLDPVVAIQMATLNCAQCFRLDHELGSIAPGKCADMVLLEDLRSFRVLRTWIDGETAASDGRYVPDLPPYAYPAEALRSVRVGREITKDAFRIPAPAAAPSVRVRAIEIQPLQAGTAERIVKLPVYGGCVQADTGADIAKAAVFERHRATGTVGLGFVKGFGVRSGAMASTVAHDAHNLLVVGVDDGDMAVAAQALAGCGGGMAVVRGGRVIGRVALPIAGLISPQSVSETAEQLDHLAACWREIGCEVESPFMTMALLSLACLPELRLTNRGLVDCRSFEFVGLFPDFGTQNEP